MTALVIALGAFFIGLIFLVKGADWLVKGGAGLAARWGVSPGVIGFTIIAFGTSLPEFCVTTSAVITKYSDVGLGNVVGSNLFNIAFILALCVLIRPQSLPAPGTRGILWREYGLMLVATGVYTVMAFRGVLGSCSSVAFLGVFFTILWYICKKGLTEPEEGLQSHGNMDYIFTILGLAGVIAGSSLFLSGAVDLAIFFGIPAYIIGLSVVAAGTSIPELVTSLVAILKGHGGVSVGNLLGSNYFNLLFILGISGLIRPIVVPEQMTTVILFVISLAVAPLFALKKDWMIRTWAALISGSYLLYLCLISF